MTVTSIFQISIWTFWFLQSVLTTTRNFELDKLWPDVSVSGMQVYGSGIVLDKENNLILLHRNDIMLPGAPVNQTITEDVVVVVDGTSGKILRSWGKNMFFWPHGIEITVDGDIFITDSNLHQVFKFQYNPLTKVWNENATLILGERFVSGNDEAHFCTPADVTVMPGTGEFYVADGYCNSRIVKFDKDGNYLLEFSAGSSNPLNPPIPFKITHAVTLAPRQTVSTGEGTNPRFPKQLPNSDDFLVFVADRDNGRIQCFNSTGTFLYEITHEQLGAPTSMLFSVSHVNINHQSPPYNSNVSAEYGIIYGVNGYLPWGQPRVFEIAVGPSNASVISSFPTSPVETKEDVMEAPHDIIVSKDGKQIFVVISQTDLVLRKFTMEVDEGSPGSSGAVYVTSVLLVASILASSSQLYI